MVGGLRAGLSALLSLAFLSPVQAFYIPGSPSIPPWLGGLY